MEYITLKSGKIITPEDLEDIDNTQAAAKFGISSERIRQIRIKLNLPKSSQLFEDRKRKRILKYLIANPNNVIICNLKKECKCHTSISEIREIAAENNLNISIFKHEQEYEHGIRKYRSRKCVCEICKLCNILHQRFCKKHTGIEIIDYLANNYINMYLEYKNQVGSRGNKIPFFNFMENIIDKIKIVTLEKL